MAAQDQPYDSDGLLGIPGLVFTYDDPDNQSPHILHADALLDAVVLAFAFFFAPYFA